jgi:hypothetical protein
MIEYAFQTSFEGRLSRFAVSSRNILEQATQHITHYGLQSRSSLKIIGESIA